MEKKKMTINEFLEKNPQISRLAGITDEQLELLSKIDLFKLSAAISKSGFLRSRRSFGWLITHYDDIIAGGYGEWNYYARKKVPSKSVQKKIAKVKPTQTDKPIQQISDSEEEFLSLYQELIPSAQEAIKETIRQLVARQNGATDTGEIK